MSAAAPENETDRVWSDAGWGPRLASPVPDHDPPLLFSLRWPQGWEADTLHAHPPAPREPAPAGGEVSPLDRLRAWYEMSGAVITQRLTLCLSPDGGPQFPLTAALSVTLAELGAPPPPDEIDAEAQPVTIGGLSGVRIRSVRPAPLGEASMVVVLVVRYLLETAQGTLGVAFAAPQAAFHDVLEPVFDDVIETVQLHPWRPETAAV